ncbi:bile salt-activated lipase-like [Saccostrea echinata]|uniref:bile salt-activated lipase-like n=1 Tax=Saccostrea echinata TaxID=191078 RepID=UPI002A8180F7|nr:bile salt-activated lipase-like [Saccostrea echinata]
MAVTLVSAYQNFTVITRLGNVNGLVIPTTKGDIFRFTGIPFGKAPVGSQRFLKPQPYGSWKRTLDATKIGPACMQSYTYASVYHNYFSEDCLQLNIYVPYNITQDLRRSVMVFIHGGAYMLGSGISIDGSRIASHGNVIVVTINYRLGMFGFPSLQYSGVDENVGLWDQILALKWIKDNIDDYGGDPSAITIFGQSAGGFSVNFQMLIPRNKGLFHRAIIESGTANSLIAMKRSSNVGRLIGKNSRCNDQDQSMFLRCLRNLDAGIIVNKTDEYSATLGIDVFYELVFTPVLDGDLLQRTPMELIRDKSSEEFQFFESIDLIAGTCDMEGAYVFITGKPFEREFNFNMSDGIPKRFLCDALISGFVQTYYENSSTISDLICQEYTSKDKTTQSLNVAHYLTDFPFLLPTINMLQAHASSKSSSTYQFIFSEGEHSLYPKFPSWLHGAGHGTELIYLFDARKLANSNFTLSAKQAALSLQLIEYWTNFAKTGNPNGPNKADWLPYLSNTESYKQLSIRNMTNGNHYRKDYVKLYNTINGYKFLTSTGGNMQSRIILILVVLFYGLKLFL